MEFTLLIATRNEQWGNETRKELERSGYVSELVTNGKDCQIRVSKKKFQAVILDIELQNHSAIEVLKYIKFVHPSLKILLLMKNKNDLNFSSMNSTNLNKAGISEVVHSPHTLEKIKKSLNDIKGCESWKGIKLSGVV